MAIEPLYRGDTYNNSSTLFDYINTLSVEHLEPYEFWNTFIYYTQDPGNNELFRSDSHLREMLGISECCDEELIAFLNNIQAINENEKKRKCSRQCDFMSDCALTWGEGGDRDICFIPKYLESSYFNIVNYSMLDKSNSYAAFKFILQNTTYIDAFDVENYLFFAYLVRNFEAVHLLEEKFQRQCFNMDFLRMVVLALLVQMIKSLTIYHYVSSAKDVMMAQVNDYYGEIMYIISHNDIFHKSIFEKINIECEEINFSYYVKFITALFEDFNTLFNESIPSAYSEIAGYSFRHDYNKRICRNISVMLFPFMIINGDTFKLYDSFAYAFKSDWWKYELMDPMEILSDRITKTSIHSIIPALAESKVLELIVKQDIHCSKCDLLLAALCHDYEVLKFPLERLKELLRMRFKTYYAIAYNWSLLSSGEYKWEAFHSLLYEIITADIDLRMKRNPSAKGMVKMINVSDWGGGGGGDGSKSDEDESVDSEVRRKRYKLLAQKYVWKVSPYSNKAYVNPAISYLNKYVLGYELL